MSVQAAEPVVVDDHRASDSSDIDALADEKRSALLGTSTATTPRPQTRQRKQRPPSYHINGGKADLDDKLDRATLSNRFRTFRTAFKYIHHLSPQQVDDFMASYVIYNLDWADEKAMIAALGPDYRSRVGECLQSYYGVLNHLCAMGDVEKMYIPPHMDRSASVLENQLLFERAVAEAIAPARPPRSGEPPKILDLGCGRGRVAAHMAALTRASVTGLNIDPNQVAQARGFNSAERGLAGNRFVVHDFNALPLPFADGEFDGFYQIQALSLCKDIPALFRELHRVVRPGARLSMLDWVSLPAYDAGNPEHAALMARVKPLIGAVGTPTPDSLEGDLRAAGFVVTRSENASLDGVQWPLIRRVDTYFRAVRQVILSLVRMRLLPAHFRTLINRLCLDGEAFVQMDKMGLITTSYWIVAQKPE